MVTLAELRDATLAKYPHAFDAVRGTADDFDWHAPATKMRVAIEPEYFPRRLNETGDRSAIAAKVINRCIRSGWSPEETFEAMAAHESAAVMDHYAGSDDRLRADIMRLWIKPAPEKTAAETWPDYPALAEPNTKADDKAAIAAGRWPLVHIRDRATALAAPDPVMLVETIIPDRKVIMPWGDTGCGKTYWAAEIMTAVAMRRPAFGKFAIVKPGDPGIAIAFAGEDADYFDKSRLTAIETHCQRSLQGLVYTVERAIPIDDAELFEAYRDELRRLQDITGKPIDIIMNDTLKRSLGMLKQNDDDVGRRFTFAMEALAEEFKCAVICNAHQPKSGADGGIAGSGDFTANCPVTPHLIGEKDGNRQLVSIRCLFEPKFRVGPTPAPFQVRCRPVTLPQPIAGVASDVVLIAMTEAEQEAQLPAAQERAAKDAEREEIIEALHKCRAHDLDSGVGRTRLVFELVGKRLSGESENEYLKRQDGWRRKLDNGSRQRASRKGGRKAPAKYAGLFDDDHRDDPEHPTRKWFCPRREVQF